MFGFIKRIFNRKPQESNCYLIFGYEDLDDEKTSHYYVASKWSNGDWVSSCGKTIVNVTYYEPLFNQPERLSEKTSKEDAIV